MFYINSLEIYDTIVLRYVVKVATEKLKHMKLVMPAAEDQKQHELPA